LLRTTSILTLTGKWAGLAQGFEVRRERRVGGKVEQEISYGMTSLTEQEADAARLLGLVRDHWRIENCLHYVRDVTLGEDACRVRTGNAPQVLAALRNVVVHLISAEAAEQEKSRPADLRSNAANIHHPMHLIGVPQGE
jgi:hypothetical protein